MKTIYEIKFGKLQSPAVPSDDQVEKYKWLTDLQLNWGYECSDDIYYPMWYLN